MMNTARFRFGMILGLILGMSGFAVAQDTPTSAVKKERINPYGNGIGLHIALTNSGFGLGGYWQRELSMTSSLIAEFSIIGLKDEREQRFFGFFGESIIPNKQNYLHTIPILVGVQKRLFSDAIKENFRPFAQASVGPTLGWLAPYYNDLNENQVRENNERSFDVISAFPKGELRMGVGGTIAIGANFGLSRKVTQGIRFGYTFTYFFSDISLLEPRVKDSQRFFGTPTITLTFGRLHR